MATATEYKPITFTAFHLFAGIGGGSLGAGMARANWMGVPGLIRNLGAIDVDAAACEDYRNLTGSDITCMDLFDREQYRTFHGKDPAASWQEATPADIRTAAGGQCPDVVFTSPPCKGFSGLLPNKSAESDKYQALNRLTVRSIRLTLEAFADAPPRIILLENVPRIKSRGKYLLDEIKAVLKSHGYACHDADHDCGEIGGLGQRRKRYLLIARHKTRCKPFIYQPPKRDLKTIGDVIGPLPLPDDPSMGPMHRLPRLKWLTWLRLALIPAGGDWRDLQKIAPEEYRITWYPRGESAGGAYSVQSWDDPSKTVIGNSRISGSSPATVADPRLKMKGENYAGSPGLYGVNEWEQPAPAVTGSASVSSSNCPAAIADPRLPEREQRRSNSHTVQGWDDQAFTITGEDTIGSGAQSIQDPRLTPKSPKYNHAYHISETDQPAGAVASGTGPSSGATCINDVRLPPSKGVFPNRFRIVRWDGQAPVVTGDTDVQCGATSIADPRLNHEPRPGNYSVMGMDETSGAVTGGQGVGVSNGPQAIADPRMDAESRSGYMRVLAMDEVSPAVIGAARTTASNGPSVVADHRLSCTPREGTYGVMQWDNASQTIIGGMNVHACQAAIEDPRLTCAPRGNTKDSLDIHSGPAAVADVLIPGNNERLDPPPVIIALDGTWHRPLTTLELMALQSFPLNFADGRPVVLAGKSDSAWRERIGNAVPPEASRRMFEQIAQALLQNALGETFTLASHETPVWVTPPTREWAREPSIEFLDFQPSHIEPVTLQRGTR